MTEIKPCRVCGSVPKIDKTRDGCNKLVTIRCKNYTDGILHEIQIVGESYDSALEYWNKVNEPDDIPKWLNAWINNEMPKHHKRNPDCYSNLPYHEGFDDCLDIIQNLKKPDEIK